MAVGTGAEGYRLESRLFGDQGMFGALDESLDFADGYFLGKAVGTFLHYKHARVYACIASDSHPLSVPLESEVVRGLLECGVRVLSFEVAPTPLVRFAATELQVQVAFSVSRGSLPDTHSGVKIFLEGRALDSERGLQLRNIAANGNWCKGKGGRLAKSEGVDAYTTRLFAETAWREDYKQADDGHERKARHVLPRVLFAQSAHGASSEVLASIAERLSAHAERVLVLQDGAALHRAMQENREQVGFLFNSDGTALRVFFGGEGECSAEELFGVLLRETKLPPHKRVVLADGFVSSRVLQDWEAFGVRTVRCASFGATLLTCLRSEREAFATISCDGHMAWSERYYFFEDAFYIALRFLSSLAMGSVRLSDLHAPALGRETGLLRILLKKDEEADDFFGGKKSLLEQLREKVWKESGDTARVEEVERKTSYGRWIVRAARFEDVLLARCEGEDKAATERVKADLQKTLTSCGVSYEIEPALFS